MTGGWGWAASELVEERAVSGMTGGRTRTRAGRQTVFEVQAVFEGQPVSVVQAVFEVLAVFEG